MTIGQTHRCYRRYFYFKKWFILRSISLWLIVFLSVCAMSLWESSHPCFTSSTDRDRLAYMVKTFSLIMTDLNVTHWIDYGTLVGALRYENIVPWDHDADVSFDRKYAHLLHNGGIAQQIAKEKYKMHLNAAVIVYEGVQTDIYSWNKVSKGEGLIYTKASNRGLNLLETQFNDFNATFIEQTVLIPFAGGYVRAPNPPMEFAKRRYPTSYKKIDPIQSLLLFPLESSAMATSQPTPLTK